MVQKSNESNIHLSELERTNPPKANVELVDQQDVNGLDLNITDPKKSNEKPARGAANQF